MYTLKKDFDFLKEILTEFCNQPSFIERLQTIAQTEITGWEIWLQVELAIFLQEHEQVSDWKREIRHSLDMRKSDYWNNASIDFYIRQKRAQSDIPLEIKQNISARACIKSMADDIKKFRNIKDSSRITGRELWCMGIHKKVEENTLKGYLSEYDCACYENCVYFYPIPDTDFMLTLI